jgi:hypothetical protein
MRCLLIKQVLLTSPIAYMQHDNMEFQHIQMKQIDID